MDIGFVGLGAMGAGIVPRLMAAGHTVTGWNRSKDKAEPLIKSGMRFADDAARRGRRVRRRVLDRDRCRRRPERSRSATTASSRACKPGGIYVDMSTIAPDASRAISAEFAERGPRDARCADLRQPGDAGARQCLASWSAATRRRSSGSSRCCARSAPR